MQIFSLVLLFVLCFPLQAFELPPDFQASYELGKYGTRVGKMHLSLKNDSGLIKYQSQSEPEGLAALFVSDKVNELSQLRLHEDIPAPQLLSYQYRREGKSKNNQQITLNWLDNHRATVQGSYRDRTLNKEIQGPVWDRLSVQLALVNDLKQSAEIKSSYSYLVADKAGLEDFTFKHIDSQLITINDRSYNTQVFKREHGKRSTILWLAPELHFLPVKMEQYRKDELKMSLLLSNIQL